MWHTQSLDEIRRQLGTNFKLGLNEEEANKRLKEYGENKLEDNKKKNIIIKFINQFNDFMIIILIIASIVSAVVSYIEGGNDYFDSIIIIVIVVFNAVMGLVQESKAEKSLEALKKMSAPTTKVRRGGKTIIIKGAEVVPGDIVVLETGNYVPADCRLIESYGLKLEESSLTGETVPALKDSEAILKNNIQIGDMSNMCFGSTVVVGGHAKAVITDTGMNTKVGKIAKMIINNESPETPIQKKLAEVGKSLGVICLGICIIIFVIGVFKNIEPVEMFMTSVGLAVAAIPEGLPAIVTIMLSIGVTKMAKKNVIIRKLPAVETLGSSKIICSDKTGTLTQNKMQVVKISDIDSLSNINDKNNISDNNMKFVLELGTMCTDCEISYENNKETIMGDPTEVAIVNAAILKGKDRHELYKKNNRINEIPFDSTRKLMTTIHKLDNGKYRIITKGAPDIFIEKCTKYYNNGNINKMDKNDISKVNKINTKMAEDALRVIAVGYLDVDILPNEINSNKIENNLIFVRINWND